jgi:hypothetical protein
VGVFVYFDVGFGYHPPKPTTLLDTARLYSLYSLYNFYSEYQNVLVF